jgi:hypothetical protein
MMWRPASRHSSRHCDRPLYRATHRCHPQYRDDHGSGSGARSSRDPLVAVRCAHEARTLGRREDGHSTPESGSTDAFRILLPWANSGNPQHGNCRCFRHSNAMLPLMESFKSGRREHGGVAPPVERQNSKPFFYLSALLGAREQTKLYRLAGLTCRAAPTC